MDAKPSKSDVKAKLRQTADTMSSRLDDLRGEVTSTGSSVRDWLVQNPMASVGGMLAAGLVVGVLFGGGSKRRRRKAHAALIDQYVDALSDEVRQAAKKGTDPDQALEAALRDRVPLVVYTAAQQEPRGAANRLVRNVVGETFEVLLHTGLSLVLREVLETVLDDADVEGIVSGMLNDGDVPEA